MNASNNELADELFMKMAVEEGGMPVSARRPLSRRGLDSPFSGKPLVPVAAASPDLERTRDDVPSALSLIEDAVAVERQLRELVARAQQIQTALAISIREQTLSKAG